MYRVTDGSRTVFKKKVLGTLNPETSSYSTFNLKWIYF